MDPRELAEKIAYLVIERGFTYDEDLMREFQVDDFDLIKAKNVLCRYYGIAFEKWHKEGDGESRQALFLNDEFSGDGAADLVRKVFHDPDFKTRRRLREDARKAEVRGEVEEIFSLLQQEWGGLLESSKPES